MSQKLPIGVAFVQGPGTILQRPNLHGKIIQIIDAWNQAERRMCHFYAFLIGLDLPRIAGFAPPPHPIAYQIFDELDNFRPKRELFEAQLKWRLAPRPGMKGRQWQKVYDKYVSPTLSTANKARNRIVHACWGVSDKFPNDLIFAPIFGHAIVWRESDFEVELQKILKAHSLMIKFEAKLRKSRTSGGFTLRLEGLACGPTGET